MMEGQALARQLGSTVGVGLGIDLGSAVKVGVWDCGYDYRIWGVTEIEGVAKTS
jgi:hypothetical protein